MVAISLGMILSSCISNPTGNGKSPVFCTVIVQNPEAAAPIGFKDNTNNRLYWPGFKLEITVNTLNSANQAVFYSTKTVQFTHSDIEKHSYLSFSLENIELPISGAYVVQYQLRSMDCTWPQTKGYYNINYNGSASKKYFKDQQTFMSATSGTVNFFTDFSLRYTKICC